MMRQFLVSGIGYAFNVMLTVAFVSWGINATFDWNMVTAIAVIFGFKHLIDFKTDPFLKRTVERDEH